MCSYVKLPVQLSFQTDLADLADASRPDAFQEDGPCHTGGF